METVMLEQLRDLRGDVDQVLVDLEEVVDEIVKIVNALDRRVTDLGDLARRVRDLEQKLFELAY